MLNIKEFLIIESFEIGNKPNRMTPVEYKKLLLQYLKPKYKDKAEVALENILNNYEDLKIFKSSVNNVMYIIFYGKEKDEKYYTIHFNDIDKIDNFKNTGTLGSNSIKLFSYVFNIIYYYGLEKGHNIILNSDPTEDRSNFYKRISENIIKKQQLDYSVVKNKNNVLLKNNNVYIPFTERFL